MAEYNEKGEEIPDKRPVAMPVGYERPEPLEVMVARMVRVASNHSAALGNETLEEANDFGEEEEDESLASPYQFKTMEEEYLDEESRTNSKGRTAGTAIDKKDAGTDSGKVSDDRNEPTAIDGGGRQASNYRRRAEDKARTNTRRERRQTAADSEAGRQGSRTDL